MRAALAALLATAAPAQGPVILRNASNQVWYLLPKPGLNGIRLSRKEDPGRKRVPATRILRLPAHSQLRFARWDPARPASGDFELFDHTWSNPYGVHFKFRSPEPGAGPDPSRLTVAAQVPAEQVAWLVNAMPQSGGTTYHILLEDYDPNGPDFPGLVTGAIRRRRSR